MKTDPKYLQRELTLLLPTRNEHENIVPQIREIYSVLPELNKLIVVDDNSDDGTRDLVQEHFPELIAQERLLVVWRTQDLGLASSLKQGVMMAETRLVGWMAADLSMNASTIPILLRRIGEGFDACIGSRFHRSGAQKDIRHKGKESRAEIMFSNILNLSLRALLKKNISDFTSGFIVGRTEIFRGLSWKGSHGEYFIHMIAELVDNGFRLTEIPYTAGNRHHGKSKTSGSLKSSISNSWRYSRAMFSVVSRDPGNELRG